MMTFDISALFFGYNECIIEFLWLADDKIKIVHIRKKTGYFSGYF